MGYFSSIIPLNAPNLLTIARIVLIPVMVLLLLGDHGAGLELAAAVFGVAAITDAADGHLARSRNMITTFGRLADPVADKLLVGAALLSLVVIDRLALWIAVVVLVREIVVSFMRWHAGLSGIVLSVSSFGKAKTGAQMTAIPLLMLVTDPTAGWVEAILLLVVAVTVASGLDYAVTYARQATAPDPADAVPVARW